MRIEENFDLTLYNSYRIKAICKRAFFPSTPEDFIEIYTNFGSNKKIILGGGYNVILSKDYYDDDFILIGESFSNVVFNADEIVADAGIDLKSLSELALANQLTGMEIFYDIPSSLGGAVVMNAGASGEDIKGILIKVRYLDLQDMKLKEISRDEIGFKYRNSFFQKNTDKIVLKAWLKLKKGDSNSIREKMYSIRDARWAKQPKDYPNAGSVFKRPEGHYVGAIMDDLQLKGLSIGGAKVSEKHGGFIVNYNNASGKDIIQLIEEVQKQIMSNFNFRLEVEQRII